MGPPENSNQSGPGCPHFLGPGDSPSPPFFFSQRAESCRGKALARRLTADKPQLLSFSFFFFFFSSQSLPRSEPLIFYASLEHPLTSPSPPHTKSFKQSRRKKRKERHTKRDLQSTNNGRTDSINKAKPHAEGKGGKGRKKKKEAGWEKVKSRVEGQELKGGKGRRAGGGIGQKGHNKKKRKQRKKKKKKKSPKRNPPMHRCLTKLLIYRLLPLVAFAFRLLLPELPSIPSPASPVTERGPPTLPQRPPLSLATAPAAASLDRPV